MGTLILSTLLHVAGLLVVTAIFVYVFNLIVEYREYGVIPLSELKKKRALANSKGLAGLLFLVMKADGEVSKDEVVKAFYYFKEAYPKKEADNIYRMLVSEIEADSYVVTFNKVGAEYQLTPKTFALVSEYARNARNGLTDEERYAVVEFLFAVASVGGVSAKEWTVICKVMECFYLRKEECDYFCACYRQNKTEGANANKQGAADAKKNSGAEVSPDGVAFYYGVLGLPVGASADEVKAAYRMLAKKYHPDMVQDELLKTVYAQKFKAVNDAYKHLRA